MRNLVPGKRKKPHSRISKGLGMNVKVQAFEDQFSSLARQMGKWMDNVLGTSFRQYCPTDAWSPSVNLYEDETSFHVVADLAGVSRQSIDLRVEEGKLLLSGERLTPRPEDATGLLRMHLMEIDHGAFCRELPIPQTVDTNQIAATYRNGLLWIKLPKASDVQTDKVQP